MRFSGSGIVCIGNLLSDGIGWLDDGILPALESLGNPAHISPEAMEALLEALEARNPGMSRLASELRSGDTRKHGLSWSIGGGPAIAALAASALGLDAEVWACLGNDANGDFIEQGLKEKRVVLARESSNIPTGVFLSLDSPRGRRLVVSPGAAWELQGFPVPPSLLKAGWFLHIDGLLIERPEWLESVAQKALDAGMRISLDLSTPGNAASHGRALLNFASRFCELIFTNSNEWQALGLAWPEACSGSYAQGRRAVQPLSWLLKRGGRGASLVVGKDRFEVPGLPSLVVDETGAGDVFAAAFIAALLEGRSPGACLHAANATAAISVSYRGSCFPSEALQAAFRQ